MVVGRSIRSAAALVGVTLSCWQASQQPAAAQSTWVEVKTPQFHFYSDLEPGRAEQIALAAEQFLAAVQKLTPRDLASPAPVKLYAFADADSFAPYRVGPDNVGGFLVPHSTGTYGAFVARDDAARVVYRQVVHQMLATHFPGLPPWFSHGFAAVYGSFEVEDGVASIGLPSRAFAVNVVEDEQEGPTPLADILAADQAQMTEIGDFVDRSRSLVHYLLLGRDEFTPQLRQYMQLIADLERPHRAFETAFGLSASELEERVSEHWSGPTINYFRVPTSDLVIPQPRTRSLSPLEASLRLQELVLFTQPQEASAVATRVDSLAKKHPEDAGAWLLLATVQVRQEQWAQAAEAAQRAVKLAPASAGTHVLLGQSLVGVAGVGQEEEETAARAQAVEHLERALELEPDNVLALERLCLAYAGLPEIGDRALEVGTRAVELLPARTDLVYNLLLMEGKRGRTAEVEKALHRVAALEPESELVVRGREILLQLRMREARRLMIEDRLADALGVLSEVHARTTSETLRAQAAERMRAVSQVQAHNRFAERYNEAVVAYRAGDWERAESALTALSSDAASEYQEDVASRLLEEVRYWRD